jgi:hypothetical protein
MTFSSPKSVLIGLGTNLAYRMCTAVFQVIKRLGCGFDFPLSCSAELKAE